MHEELGVIVVRDFNDDSVLLVLSAGTRVESGVSFLSSFILRAVLLPELYCEPIDWMYKKYVMSVMRHCSF